MIDDILYKLCADRSIKLRDIAKEGGIFNPDAKSYINRSTYSLTEITLGVYANQSHRVISFFHELGHIDDIQNTSLPPILERPYNSYHEASAWRTGLKVASENNIFFTVDTILWAMDQLNTYFVENPDSILKSDISYLHDAIVYAFGEVKPKND